MPKMRWIVVAAGLLLVGVLCDAAAAAEARFNFRTWSPISDSGSFLPQSSVNTMTQSRNGYLWLGTEGGIARFDGLNSSTFNDNNTPGLKSSRISCLFEDSHGNLWIGTKNAGIVLVKDGRVESVPSDVGFHAGPLRSACEDSSGSVWLYTEDGQLLRYRDGSIGVGDGGTNRPSNCRVVIAEKSGPVWMGSADGLYTTGTMTNPAQAGPPRFKISSVNQVDYLVASRGGGFWCLADGHVQKWRNFNLERDFGTYPWTAPITSACEDQEGNLVVGTYGDATYWMDSQGHFSRVARDDGALDTVFSLLVDRDDDLWIGTDGLGVSRVKRSPFSVLEQSKGRTVQSVCEDSDGSLWVGLFGAGTPSVVSINPQTGAVRQYGTNVQVKSVLVDRTNQVWAGTWGPWEPWWARLQAGGLFKLQTDSIPQPQYVQTSPSQGVTRLIVVQRVSALFQDRTGLLWAGSMQGLWQNDGHAWKLFTTSDGLSSDDVRALADDAGGNLWIGTADGGLDCLHDGKIVSFHKSDGLPSEHISSLYMDDQGVLWVGTSGGLGRLQGGKWTAYTTANGLASDSVQYILDDGQGNLWLGSNLGLMRIARKALDDFAQSPTNLFACRTFGRPDGLPASECSSGSQPAACRTHDGRLWFPTITGLVGVDPASIRPNTNPPPVIIENVRIDGVRQNADTLGAAPITNLTIPAGSEQLDIQYTSLNLAAADKARFRYQMEPYISRWAEVGDRRVASYPNLPPGKYTFRVSACNEDGVWSDEPATLAIIVLPPFWRTAWFISGTSLFLLALIVGAVYYVSTQKLQRQLAGLRQQQALEKERARIARDIHDQLGASLTQVSLLGEMVESDKDSPAEVVSHARQISLTARDTSRALDEIVWTVNPSNDTLEGLVNYVCKYAQEYLAVADLRYRLDVPAQLPPVIITPEVRHNVFLAAKESITNIVRHARATSAFIRLRLEPGVFILEIQDDGRGIPNLEEKLAGSRNGLRNMVKRMEDIGGSFAAGPAPGGGTLISLTVPIQKH
jgi:ligand-binding sensor domain-containing protein/signal transduction histidine kinase